MRKRQRVIACNVSRQPWQFWDSGRRRIYKLWKGRVGWKNDPHLQHIARHTSAARLTGNTSA